MNSRDAWLVGILLSSLIIPSVQAAPGYKLGASCEKYRPVCANAKMSGVFGKFATPICMMRTARKNKDQACLGETATNREAFRASLPRVKRTWKRSERIQAKASLTSPSGASTFKGSALPKR